MTNVVIIQISAGLSMIFLPLVFWLLETWRMAVLCTMFIPGIIFLLLLLFYVE